MSNHTAGTSRAAYLCALLGNIRGHDLEFCEELVPSLRDARLEVGTRVCYLLLQLNEARGARSEFRFGHCDKGLAARFRSWGRVVRPECLLSLEDAGARHTSDTSRSVFREHVRSRGTKHSMKYLNGCCAKMHAPES